MSYQHNNNNTESYSNKSSKPNNTSFSTGKKVNFRQNRKKQLRKKAQIVTAIMVDSMVKDIYGWELSDHNEKVVVKYFSGLPTEDMMTHIKPPLKHNPDCFIIDVRANNWRSDQNPETIAENIVEIANNKKTDTNKVLISSIVPRRDNSNGKGCQVEHTVSVPR